MPKIAAASIEEHVRNQEARILTAARERFTANGYRGTDMRDIAASMGLARNSLYRYFSSKDHILVAVVRREMQPFFDQLADLGTRIDDPVERIDAWVMLQMELAAGPCHTMMGMLGEIPPNAHALRQEISTLHAPPKRWLQEAVEQVLDGSTRDPLVVTAMIAGMVQSAAGVAMRTGRHDACVAELRSSIGRILIADCSGRRQEVRQ